MLYSWFAEHDKWNSDAGGQRPWRILENNLGGISIKFNWIWPNEAWKAAIWDTSWPTETRGTSPANHWWSEQRPTDIIKAGDLITSSGVN